MTLVAGIDSSTQSTKIVLCDADSGEVLASGSAPHPAGTAVPAQAWWAALREANRAAGDALGRAAAVSVAGQQHGMVLVDEAGQPVHDALLWNDTRSGPQAAALIRELGGPAAWAARTGLVPVASFTVTKLRWMAEHRAEASARARAVMLPHDYLTWRLGGGALGSATTDRGDASGTGYFSPVAGRYDEQLLRLAFGRDLDVPRVAGPADAVGMLPSGALLAPGTGDNMGAALGLGLEAGDIAVSIGTSGTAFAVSERAAQDPTGTVAGFADATGRFLPLVATMNAGLVLDATAALLGVDHAGLAELALRAPSGSDGLVLLPYIDGERTPDLPHATGSLHGLTRRTMSREHLARASIEGVLLGLADGVEAIVAQGVEPRRILMIGGAAQSAAVQVVAATVFGLPIEVPAAAQYVALGAARQAAWTLSGAPCPPQWGAASVARLEPRPGGEALRAAYAAARFAAHGR